MRPIVYRELCLRGRVQREVLYYIFFTADHIVSFVDYSLHVAIRVFVDFERNVNRVGDSAQRSEQPVCETYAGMTVVRTDFDSIGLGCAYLTDEYIIKLLEFCNSLLEGIAAESCKDDVLATMDSTVRVLPESTSVSYTN